MTTKLNKKRVDGYEFIYEKYEDIPEELKGMELGIVTEEIYANDSDGYHHKFDVWKLERTEEAIEEAFKKTIKNKDFENINLWYVEKDAEDEDFYKEIIDGNKYSPIWVKQIIDIYKVRRKAIEKATFGILKVFENVDELVEKIKETIKDDIEGSFEIEVDESEEWGWVRVYSDDLEDEEIKIAYDITADGKVDVTDVY